MAAFGNAVADFQIVAQSPTAGYIIAIDLSANLIDTVKQVQGMDSTVTFGTPVVSGVTIDVLLGYLASSSPPPLAWSQTANTLYVFFSEAKYPAAQANRVGIFFDRNTIPLTADTDFVDVPEQYHQLVVFTVIKETKQRAGKRLEFDDSQNIVAEKTRLGLT